MAVTSEDYVYGSAGSLLMVCPKCGRDHYRNPFLVYSPQYCVWCGDVELRPVLRAELQQDGAEDGSDGGNG